MIIRASAFGGCDRAILASLYGEPSKPTTKTQQQAFKRGNDAEPKILANIEKKNKCTIGDRQLELAYEVNVAGKVYRLQGHPDGIIDSVHRTIVEAKCLNSDSANNFRRNPVKYHRKYTFQASIYAYLAQQHFELPKPPGIIFGIYDWEQRKHDILSYPVPFHTWKEITTRLFTIAGYHATHNYPEFCNEYSFFCDYTLCNQPPKPMTDNPELTNLLASYQILKDQSELAKQKVLDHLEAHPNYEYPIRTTGHTISRTEETSYDELDKDSVRTYMGDTEYSKCLTRKTRKASISIRAKSVDRN